MIQIQTLKWKSVDTHIVIVMGCMAYEHRVLPTASTCQVKIGLEVSIYLP